MADILSCLQSAYSYNRSLMGKISTRRRSIFTLHWSNSMALHEYCLLMAIDKSAITEGSRLYEFINKFIFYLIHLRETLEGHVYSMNRMIKIINALLLGPIRRRFIWINRGLSSFSNMHFLYKQQLLLTFEKSRGTVDFKTRWLF